VAETTGVIALARRGLRDWRVDRRNLGKMPAARELDEGIRFPLCQPDALEQAFRNAGLAAIQVVPIDVPTRFRDFDDYWTPFLGGQGRAPSYAMSMDEMSRNRLRDRIRGRLPCQSDGSIPLVARAWAFQSRVPGSHYEHT